MSMVTVHGPNTMYTTEGGGTPVASSPVGAQAIKSPANGLIFSFSFPNPGARSAADFDWTFTGPGSPAAQADRFSGTVTYTGAGAGTIICTVAAGAGPPTAGAYTIPVTATAGMPRDAPPEGGEGGGEPEGFAAQSIEESSAEVPIAFDPAAHTVVEVEDYADQHPEQAQDLIDAEVAGKNRSTLVNYLTGLVPFDPGSHTVAEVEDYVTANPDKLNTVYQSELGNKNRSTLITWLEGQGATAS